MSDAAQRFSDNLSGHGLRVAIVQARFNEAITDALCAACVGELKRLRVTDDPVFLRVVSVPGALEIPFALEALGGSGGWDAMVAIGCVIRGETYHFELVCNESCRGVAEVSLASGVPIANAILTVENEAQALARIDKGRDAARVAIEMAWLARDLRDG
jgi:6,7-dimethyl-8-ribityllumazine synthase